MLVALKLVDTTRVGPMLWVRPHLIIAVLDAKAEKDRPAQCTVALNSKEEVLRTNWNVLGTASDVARWLDHHDQMEIDPERPVVVVKAPWEEGD